MPDLAHLDSVDRAYVTGIIDRSLQRLKVERLDLVQFHWWDYGVPGAIEAAAVLRELQVAGKIEHVGGTNFDTPHTRALIDAGIPLVAMQVQYSLLDARPEHALVPLAIAKRWASCCYGTLAGGFLSEAWLGKPEPQDGLTNRSLIKYKLIIDDFGGWALFQRLLGTLEPHRARGSTASRSRPSRRAGCSTGRASRPSSSARAMPTIWTARSACSLSRSMRKIAA